MTQLDTLRAWTQYFSSTDHLNPDWKIQPDFTHSSLRSVFRYLQYLDLIRNDTTLVITDYDNTVRDQNLGKLLGRFGEIRPEDVALLLEIARQWCRLLVITNQTDCGHLVAKFFGELQNYDYFPKVLQENEIDYLAAPPFQPPLMFPPYKSTQLAIDQTLDYVRSHPPKHDSIQYTDVVVIGDQPTDMEFANHLYAAWTECLDPSIIMHLFLLNPKPPIKVEEPELATDIQLIPA